MQSLQLDLERASRYTIFQGISQHELVHILERGTISKVSRGEKIFCKGCSGNQLFILLDGVIGIYSDDKFIAKIKAGDAFGEMAVLNKKPRSATATATTEVQLLTLDEALINDILGKEGAVRFLLNIIRLLSYRLEAGNAWISADIESRRQGEV